MTRLLLLPLLAVALWSAPRTSSAADLDLTLMLDAGGGDGLTDRLSGRQMAFAAGAAAVAVPAAFFGARLVGSLSSNPLPGAALPAVLAFALIPPAATAGAALWAGGGRFWPAFGLGVGTQVVAFAAAVLLDVSAVRPLALAIFSVLDAAALAAITVSSFHWFPAGGGAGDLGYDARAETDRDRSAPPASLSSFSMAF